MEAGALTKVVVSRGSFKVAIFFAAYQQRRHAFENKCEFVSPGG